MSHFRIPSKSASPLPITGYFCLTCALNSNSITARLVSPFGVLFSTRLDCPVANYTQHLNIFQEVEDELPKHQPRHPIPYRRPDWSRAVDFTSRARWPRHRRATAPARSLSPEEKCAQKKENAFSAKKGRQQTRDSNEVQGNERWITLGQLLEVFPG